MAARTGRSGDAQGQLAEYRRKRDFTKTAEPSGADSAPGEGVLRFVVQKHAASHLHFDLRLEMDGVMKSWAVPKGPSVDPSVKRLAMQVEDHPIDYNTFEGTIPKGEYGGGTVMLWDQGTYIADGATIQEAEAVLRERHQKGDLKLTFFGERMKGSWALVRMKYSRDGSSSAKPQWLFIKHRDEFAAESDIVAENTTSVTTGRTMDEIASGKSRVWHSNRTDNVKRTLVRQTPSGARAGTGTAATKTGSSTSAVDNAGAIDALTRQLEPMYASIGTRAPGAGWNFEPKYDGIRVLAFVAGGEVRLVTRNGKDKSAQFPEVVESLRSLGAKKMKNYILDGEIVALIDGEPGRFQELQGRMHVQEAHIIARHRTSTPAALILFDILAAGDDILIREPWEKRRKRLVKELGKATSPQIWV
ncbi:MAG: hypothetical protein M3Q89_11055, partial [Verrucomicrobiota bacterium]|nr:hypothetical protein [Verrucomicrobiota bacterium]